ncbi:MAG: HisA/HisF-related TIM barrel protein [Hyphomicrobiaceae bacterium]
MNIIPVLDIKAGEVVHARGGDRNRYAPIRTPLSRTSDPVDVTRGLLQLHPFAALYIADLDAIMGRGRNHDSICALRHAFPSLDVWIDDASSTPQAVARLAAMGNVRPVVGSESLERAADFERCREVAGEAAILSLDFKGSGFLGPDALLEHPVRWPRTVIAMTLGAVGAQSGPDLARVRQVKASKTDAEIIAAGGVRDLSDLAALADAGAAGVLVATALHSGALSPADIAAAAGL